MILPPGGAPLFPFVLMLIGFIYPFFIPAHWGLRMPRPPGFPTLVIAALDLTGGWLPGNRHFLIITQNGLRSGLPGEV